jgi:hypothetical protein
MSDPFKFFENLQRDLAGWVKFSPEDDGEDEEEEEKFIPLDWGEELGMMALNVKRAEATEVADGIMYHEGVQIVMPAKAAKFEKEYLDWLAKPPHRRPSSMDQPVITRPIEIPLPCFEPRQD